MKKKIISILALVLILSLALVGLIACKDTRTGYPDADKYSVGGTTIDAASVKAINITWTGGQATITASDEYSNITFSEENDRDEDDYKIHYYLDSDHTLWIKPVAGNIGDDGIPSNWTAKQLIFTMPNRTFESITIEQHGAKLVATGLVANSLSTYNTGYDTSVSNAHIFGDATLACQGLTGDVSFSGIATGDLKVTAVLHSYVNVAAMPKSILASGKGKVTAYVPDTTAGFKVTYRSITTFHNTQFDGLYDAPNPQDYDEAYVTKAYNGGQTQIILSCATRDPLIGDTYNDTYLYKHTEEV